MHTLNAPLVGYIEGNGNSVCEGGITAVCNCRLLRTVVHKKVRVVRWGCVCLAPHWQADPIDRILLVEM